MLTVEMVNENSFLEAWNKGRLTGSGPEAGDPGSPVPVSCANELAAQFNG